jgi:3-hydroxyisobutyrate dehydrogenase
MFKDAGAKMIAVFEGKEDGKGKVLGGYVETLRKAVDEAQAIKCPLYLGTSALNLLLQTGSELSLGSLLKCYMP